LKGQKGFRDLYLGAVSLHMVLEVWICIKSPTEGVQLEDREI
jgi:hypothetical protein